MRETTVDAILRHFYAGRPRDNNNLGLMEGTGMAISIVGVHLSQLFCSTPISVQGRRMDSHRTSLERPFGHAYLVSGDIRSRVDSFWDTQGIHQSSETKRI